MKKLLSILIALAMLLGVAGASAQEAGADIVILYTNDAHCAVDSNVGYAGLATYRDKLIGEGNYVTLVDCGDAIQGKAVGTLSKGSYIIDIMNKVGYDIAIPGNHEFDYGMERFFELTKAASFPYVSCNFVTLPDDKPVFDAYKIIDYGGVKVAYVGICTPKTITSSAPVYFQNDAGEYIYGFCQDQTGEGLYNAVQQAVDAARTEGADYVVALAHLGIASDCAPWMSTDVILNTTGIDVMLDGHSHSVLECERVKNKEGKEVLLSSTGTELANIGVMRITADGKLSTSLLSWNKDVAGTVADIQKGFEEMLNSVVAKTEVDLIIADPETGVRVIRNAETNLGDLCADGYRAMTGADIAFVNGGGIRAKIPAGDVTYGQIIAVHPYGNALCMVEATGQEILDALEMGARAIPDETGAFLQVSGLTYEIHTYVPSSVKLDDDGLFASVDGERRVKNVLVAGIPLEPNMVYTLASHNYMLKDKGDGYSMFADNKLILEDVMLDNEVLIRYITESLGGVVGEQYAEVYGEGRIIAFPEPPVVE